MGRYRPAVMADPYTALLRDCIVDGPYAKPAVSERDISQAAEQQLQALEQVRFDTCENLDIKFNFKSY